MCLKKYLSSFLVLFFLILATNSASALFWNKEKKQTDLILTTKATLDEKELNGAYYANAVFRVGERIYFHVYSKEGFKSNFIKYQIVKQDDNAHIGGYSRVRNVTKRVRDRNYDSEYFVMSEKGKYLVQVFNIENLNHWIAYRDFLVVDE